MRTGKVFYQRLFYLLVVVGLLALNFNFQIGKAFMNEKYEPADGRVYHGMGQYVTGGHYTDADNWKFVTDYETAVGEQPLIYSVYYSINPSTANQNPVLKSLANKRGVDKHYLLMVGLAYMDANDYVDYQAILNGDYDQYIINVAREIKDLGRPTWVRPGYEFGANSKGAHAEIPAAEYIEIWKRIWNIFKNEGVTNAAWVWNAVNPQDFDEMAYYPGDTYVDWWGINYLSRRQINYGNGFVRAAQSHNKPVIICEANPVENNGTDNNNNWENWFVPFFNKIAEFPHIKAFVYNSNPWDRAGFYDWWPNSQIHTNTYIRDKYKAELAKAKYVHNDEYQANPGVVNGGTQPTATSQPPTATQPPSGNITRLRATHDSNVNANYPTTNYGTRTKLFVDNTPVQTTYMKFDLSSYSSMSLISAKLRIRTYNGSTSTQNIKFVTDDSWTETTINYNNRPALGSSFASFSNAGTEVWLEIDITTLVQQNLGTVLSIGIDSPGGDNLVFYSDEATNKPELVLNHN